MCMVEPRSTGEPCEARTARKYVSPNLDILELDQGTGYVVVLTDTVALTGRNAGTMHHQEGGTSH
jgi:hypothetical protein